MSFPAGQHHSEEIRRKMSAAQKGKNNHNFGKHFSEEYRRKISESLKKRFKKSPISEETRRKISIANKGKPKSEEHRRKMSDGRKGENNPHYGKHHSEEARRKISESNKGRKYSEETLRRMSEAQKGKTLSEETCRKMSVAHSGENNHNFGKHHSEETKEKISRIRIESGISVGKNNPAWKGGVSFEPYCPKFNEEFRERVRSFFDHKCVECGTPQNGRKLDVHHVNFNKMSCCDNIPPIFVPLCASCHAKTQFRREYWEQHFTEMINNYYQGQSYIKTANF